MNNSLNLNRSLSTLFYTMDMGRKHGERVQMSTFSWSIIPTVALLVLSLLTITGSSITIISTIVCFVVVAGIDMVTMNYCAQMIEGR